MLHSGCMDGTSINNRVRKQAKTKTCDPIIEKEDSRESGLRVLAKLIARDLVSKQIGDDSHKKVTKDYKTLRSGDEFENLR